MAVRRPRMPATRSHILPETFAKETRAAERARARERLRRSTFARDATATRIRVKRIAPSVPNLFDLLRDASGNRVGPPVRDQGSKGSCTAHAAIGAMETLLFRRDGLMPRLSADHAFEMAKEREEMSVAVKAAAKGVLEERCFRPNAPCSTPATWKGRFRLLDEGLGERPAAMRNLLLAGMPLVTVIALFPSFRNYSGGVFSPTDASTGGGHAMVVVGYEKRPTAAGGVWICRNSFGPTWGGSEGGYVQTEWGDGFLDLETIVYVLEDVQGPS